MIKEEPLDQLKNVIAAKQCVNCFSREFSPENQPKLEQFLAELREAHKNIIYVDINIQGFEPCEDEEQEATVLMELINRELTGKGLESVQSQAISIANALYKWSNSLDRRSLLVFQCFHDLYKEKEKNILRSLRKALRNELSGYLGLLIVSNREINRWHLFPESNLDERHLAFFDLDGRK